MSLSDEFLKLEKYMEDLLPWIDWKDCVIRIYLHEHSLKVRLEPYVSSGDKSSQDSPTTICTARCVREVGGLFEKNNFKTPNAVRCLNWLNICGQSLPKPILSSLRLEVGGLTMDPATEWACWLTHLYGSVVISRHLFGESDVLITRPVQASMHAAKVVSNLYGDKDGNSSDHQVGHTELRQKSYSTSSSIQRNDRFDGYLVNAVKDLLDLEVAKTRIDMLGVRRIVAERVAKEILEDVGLGFKQLLPCEYWPSMR